MAPLCCCRHRRPTIQKVVLCRVNLHSRYVHKAPGANRSVAHVGCHAILEACEYAEIRSRLLACPVERLHVARPRTATLNLRHYVDEYTLADRQAPAPVYPLVSALLAVRLHAIYQRRGPALKAELVDICKLVGIGRSLRHADVRNVRPQVGKVLPQALFEVSMCR